MQHHHSDFQPHGGHSMTRRQACAALGALAAPLHRPALAQMPDAARRTALAVAAHYQSAPPALYIGAMIASAQRRLAVQAEAPGLLKPARAYSAALLNAAGAPGFALPSGWPQLSGYAALAKAAADGDTAAGALAVQALRARVTDTPDGPRLKGLRPWTDDMFMAVLLVEHAGPLLPAPERTRATEALAVALRDHTRRRRTGADGHRDEHRRAAPGAPPRLAVGGRGGRARGARLAGRAAAREQWQVGLFAQAPSGTLANIATRVGHADFEFFRVTP